MRDALAWVETGVAAGVAATVVAWAQPGGWPAWHVGIVMFAVCAFIAACCVIEVCKGRGA